jgi:hypothetical protein
VKLKHLAASLVVTAGTLAAPSAFAFPVDPQKVPVDIQQDPTARQFTLARDDVNTNVIYYAPKVGRIATLNGTPLLGFAVLPSTGDGFLNAQIEFGVFGADRAALLGRIQAAGKTPVTWPFRRTKVVPMTPEVDPETGREVCEDVPDPVTGGVFHDCSGQIFKAIVFSSKGPTLGENISISAQLKPVGAAVFQNLLHSGAALVMGLDAEYLAAGRSFSATVTVKYDKLFENFRTYASFHGFLCTDIQVETFFQNETVCEGRDPSECGVFITYRDGVTGQVITTPTIDPDNAEQQNEIFQAVERLAQTLRDQMLAPVTANLGPLDRDRPTGFKLDAKYERQHKGLNATFQFTSPNGVNAQQTHIDGAIGCVDISPDGHVSRDFTFDCPGYWQ